MATALKSTALKQITPEEYTSYQNIAESFPPVFEEGKRLLAEVAGKIQIMRLETEIFPQLTVDGNKGQIKDNERLYCSIEKQVAEFRETLQSINGQILRAISLCGSVPSSDIRSFELNATATKVFDFCQRSLPTLNDWRLQGALLDKRFELVMTKDYKHYTESIGNYKAAITPSSGFFGTFSSTLTNLFSRAEAAVAEPVSPIRLEAQAQAISQAYVAIDNALLEVLCLQAPFQAFLDKVAPKESSTYSSYQEQIGVLKAILTKLVKQEPLRNIAPADVEAALLELQKATALALVSHIKGKTYKDLEQLFKASSTKEIIVKIDANLQGGNATTGALKDSLQRLLDTELGSYSKPAKDPHKTELFKHLVLLASTLK
jgi:hypothetical protein